MKTYLVGGAVRDKLLGLPVLDRDWVVVGETPDAMLQAGYIAVGKDFPVFLHPESHEEYALARKERKTGPGYHGFEFDTASSVTLEEDLSRRDLTINAIAEDEHGNLIDPFNGQQDIQAKLLRHVAPAFTEDPVRVLRIAKFMARFASLGFAVENSTIELIRSMVTSGEVDNLVAERVWKELEAALNAESPAAFFTTLQDTNALGRILPELAKLTQTKNKKSAVADEPALSFLPALETACAKSGDSLVRFAAMCAEFGPAGVAELQAMCTRLRTPNAHAELGVMCAQYAQHTLQANTLNAEQLQSLLKALDVSRRADRFDAFLLAVQSLDGNPQAMQSTIALMQGSAQAMLGVNAGQIARDQTDKTQIPTAIKQHEVAAIEAYLADLFG